MEKNVLELARKRFGNSTGLKLFEDLVFFIAGKAGCISHAVPNYVPMIEKGLIGLVKFASEKEKECLTSGNKEAMAKAEFYQAVQIALNGILEYACHLAEKAELLASITADANQKKNWKKWQHAAAGFPLILQPVSEKRSTPFGYPRLASMQKTSTWQ